MVGNRCRSTHNLLHIVGALSCAFLHLLPSPFVPVVDDWAALGGLQYLCVFFRRFFGAARRPVPVFLPSWQVKTFIIVDVARRRRLSVITGYEPVLGVQRRRRRRRRAGRYKGRK